MPVMAKPSAENVGREFVRQYYTMLNRDPRQVHRFYSKDSVFFHGGPSNTRGIQPAVGQEEIYEKIEQLKFNDCHAKILQVDSQFTVGESVVVQVCGEFSNNGEPTKKFVQTFVLAPEGLKKYHVHNDIFRYQEERFSDEVSDETGEGTNDSEGDEDVIDERSLDGKSSNFDKLVNHVEEESPGLGLPDEDEEKKTSSMTNGSSSTDDEMPNKENGVSHETELEEVVVEKPESVVPLETPVTNYSDESQDNSSNVPDSTADQNSDEKATPPVEPEIPNEAEQEPVQGQSDHIMSWAALASKTPKHSPQNVRAHEARKLSQTSTAQSSDSVMMQKSQTAQQRVRDSGNGRNTGGANSGNKDNTRLSGRNAPDNYQVFIGNLPNGLEEKKVHEVFSKFGKIVEIRLNPKNFGFVIFDSPEPAEQVLKSGPITVGGQEINIEEKKPSGSLGRGGRAGSSGNRGKSGVSGRGGGMVGRGGTPGGKGNNSSTQSTGARGGGGNQRGSGSGGGTSGGGGSGTSNRGRHNRR